MTLTCTWVCLHHPSVLWRKKAVTIAASQTRVCLHSESCLVNHPIARALLFFDFRPELAQVFLRGQGAHLMVVHSEVGWSQVESGCQGLPGHSGPHTNRSQCCHGTVGERSCPGHHTGGCGSVTQGRHAAPGHSAADVRRASGLRRNLPEPWMGVTKEKLEINLFHNPCTLTSPHKVFCTETFIPTTGSYHDMEK